MPKKTRLLCMLLVMFLLLVTACNKPEVEPTPTQTDTPYFINLLPIPTEPEVVIKPLDLNLKEKVEEKYKLNKDSFGWLQVSGTTLDDVVMFAPDNADRFFYLRRGFDKQNLFEGSYFIHSSSHFNGGRDGMSQNIVIYGHSMTDDPNANLFSQLKKYTDPEWAKEHPYIYFGTLEEDMAWEIFAVFYTDINFAYNIPDPTGNHFSEIIEGAQKRSLYNYNVPVKDTDHIITLSTCIYNYYGTPLSYPNNYRYVVMGRLVPPGEALKNEAELKANDHIYRD